jgi:hypothetical protein
MGSGMIPATTNRLHLSPYWKGDSPRAINVAGARRVRGRGRYIDMNFQVCRDNVMGLHWDTAAKNGYRFIQVSRIKRRPMTREELYRPVGSWSAEDIKKWRRTARVTRKYESRVRPYTFTELIQYAKRRGVIICAELKSRRFGTDPTIAEKMYANCVKYGVTVYPMTLVTMAYWAQKMINFKRAGFETALLAHNARRPANLAGILPYIDRVWGRFSS